MARQGVLVLLLASAGLAAAAESVRPFVAGSLATIIAAREGKPFIVAFWSVACTHCPAELKMLGELKRQYPKLDVVLVAADTPEQASATARLAASYGLGRVEQWVFADPMPERLRFEIDRRWYGELPRTQLYDGQHRIESVSGVVPRDKLLAWMKTHVQPHIQ
jgi:thiol-disulfide isomerase/thioredoxin